MPKISLIPALPGPITGNERVVANQGEGEDEVTGTAPMAALVAAAVAPYVEQAEDAVARVAIFSSAIPPAALGKVIAVRRYGFDPSKFYFWKWFWHNDAGTRFRITVAEAIDAAGAGAVDVCEISTAGIVYPDYHWVTATEIGGSGKSLDALIHFDGNWALYDQSYAQTGMRPLSNEDTPARNANVDARADARIAFEKTIAEPWKLCADPYAQALFGDVAIAGLDPDDKPFPNYETAFFPSLPLYRIRVYLHSTKIGGGAVALWSKQSATLIEPEDLPSEIQLSMKADGKDASKDALGNPVLDTNGNALQEVGVTAFIKPDWTKLDWSKSATTYTSAEHCPISPRVIITADEIEKRWLARMIEPRRKITIGALRGDYPTLVAATQAYENLEAAATITRSTYPITNLIGPEWPALFEIIDPHSEAVGNFVNSGIAQSNLRVMHGALIRARYDTHLYKAVSSNSAPLMEMSNTSAIEANGALLENQDNEGYILHWDAVNGLSARLVSDGQLRRRIQTVLHGARLQMAAGNNDPLIGAGMSDGQTMLNEQVDFKRLGNDTTAMVVCHGSPNSVDPGNLIFRSCTSNDAQITAANAVIHAATPGDLQPSRGLVQVLKSKAGSHRHILTVDDCDTGGVSYANTFGDGLPGWVARGRMSGVAIPAELRS